MQIFSIEPGVLQTSLRSYQNGWRHKAGIEALLLLPLLYDRLVRTNSLEKRLLLIKSSNITFRVQSFLGWLSTPPPLTWSMSPGLCCPISPSGRQSGRRGTRTEDSCFLLVWGLHFLLPLNPDYYSSPSFNFVLRVSFLFGTESIY